MSAREMCFSGADRRPICERDRWASLSERQERVSVGEAGEHDCKRDRWACLQEIGRVSVRETGKCVCER